MFLRLLLVCSVCVCVFLYLVEHADAVLRALQVDEDADRVLVLGLDRADRARDVDQPFAAVREVESEDVGPREEEPAAVGGDTVGSWIPV